VTPREWFEIVSVVIALLAFLSGARSLKSTRRTSRGQFWLDLRQLFARDDYVHRKLHPGDHAHPQTPDLVRRTTGPTSKGTWDPSHTANSCCNRSSADFPTFRAIYAYRAQDLLANDQIGTAKLMKERRSWTAFAQLATRLGFTIPESAA